MRNFRLTAAAAYFVLTLLAAGADASAQQSPGAGEKCPGHIVVEGAVPAPTRFEPRGDVRLLDALVRAGGISEDAEGTIRVTRPAPGCGDGTGRDKEPPASGRRVYQLRDIKDAQVNPTLLPGDVVTVERAAMVYVTGGVRQPVALYLKGSVTVKQAVALAGGWRRGARPDKARIYRRAPGSDYIVTTAGVNLKAIMKRQAEDVELQANDILWVPCKECGKEPSPTLPPPWKPNSSAPQLRVIY